MNSAIGVKQGSNIHDNKALRYAAQSGHLDMVKLLVENGINIYADNEWALQVAAQNGHLEVVKFLVEHGADIHVDNDWSLRMAVQQGYLEVVKFLMEHKANIHIHDNAEISFFNLFDDFFWKQSR